jgi:hypothetical protein
MRTPIQSAPTRKTIALSAIIATEDDEAEDIVEHRGAQDQARLARLVPAQVLEHARGDPDRGGAQGRSNEGLRVDGRVGNQEHRHPHAEHGGRDHAGHGHPQRGEAHPKHLGNRRLQSDLEEQEKHAETGEESEFRTPRGLIEGWKHRASDHAEDDPGDQFAQDRGLSEHLGEVTEDLGGNEDDGERHGNRDHGVIASRGPGRCGHEHKQSGGHNATHGNLL